MKHKVVEDRCYGYIVETFRFHKSGQLFNHLNNKVDYIDRSLPVTIYNMFLCLNLLTTSNLKF